MASKSKNRIRQVECRLAEALSGIKSIALQLVEFVLFMYGLIMVFVHALK